MDKYWFKRKRYGYGWTPVTWQGWTAVAIYLGLVIGAALVFGENPTAEETLVYLLFFSITTLLLLVVTYFKGPAPKWRWGKKSKDNPEEDY